MTGDREVPKVPGGTAAALLAELAVRAAVITRLEPESSEALLRSIAEATVALFNAEAASIALHAPASDQLVIRVAAGAAGDGAVGLAFPADQGIAGYVFTTGQPLAVSDVHRDPRFGRSVAEMTGYLPRSILAVPLLDDAGTLGVLEVLDRHGDAGFGMREIELAAVFARQATVAIRAGRVERDVAELLRVTLARLAEAGGGAASAPDAIEDLVAAGVAGITVEGDDRLWSLADAVARARHAAPDQVALVVEILEALARRAQRPGSRFRR